MFILLMITLIMFMIKLLSGMGVVPQPSERVSTVLDIGSAFLIPIAFALLGVLLLSVFPIGSVVLFIASALVFGGLMYNLFSRPTATGIPDPDVTI